jgi:hypothetical protein
MYKYLLSIMLMLSIVSGCDSVIQKDYPKQQSKTVIANVIIREHLLNPVTNVVIDTKHKRSECPECKGTGKLKSGDGLKTVDCNYCEPDTKQEAVSEPMAAVQYFGVTPGQKCCKHCICGDECNCTYPGQCLVEKNGGWSVYICEQGACANCADTCTLYAPHDATGKPYDPYKYAVEIGAITPENAHEYSAYKKPLKINKHGNLIK